MVAQPHMIECERCERRVFVGDALRTWTAAGWKSLCAPCDAACYYRDPATYAWVETGAMLSSCREDAG